MASRENRYQLVIRVGANDLSSRPNFTVHLVANFQHAMMDDIIPGGSETISAIDKQFSVLNIDE